MTHVDNFIDKMCFESTEAEVYAQWVLNHARLPASLQSKFDKFMNSFPLFCTYEGKIYRVTGASRMGDVWLAKDFNRLNGYDLRVDVDKVTNWSNKPDGSYDLSLFPTKPSYDTSEMVTA